VTVCVLTRLVGSKSFPSVRSVTRDTRLRLPSSGSLGPHFPTFIGTMLGGACPEIAEGTATCPSRCPVLSLVHRYLVCPFGSCPRLRASSLILRNACINAWPAWSPGTPFPGCSQGNKWLSQACPEALLSLSKGLSKGSQVTPLNACPALRPRWSPQHSP
jgi:hypothetical protein